jgi:hypothetical protein
VVAERRTPSRERQKEFEGRALDVLAARQEADAIRRDRIVVSDKRGVFARRHWVAYGTNPATRAAARGATTVYVQPFPATGEQYQISRRDEDGHHPLWSPDGKELSYIPQAGQLVGVSVSTQPSFSVGNPVPIPRAFNFGNTPAYVRSHDITRTESGSSA